MKYELLLSLGCFSRKDLADKTGNVRTADSLIYFYRKKGLLIPVKQNLYTVRSLETGAPVLNVFEVASHTTPTACISNHSAFEWNGMQNQVFNEIYVASETPFKPFEYDFRTIKYVPMSFSEGIEKRGSHIRVTNLERTLVDSLKNISKISMLEEVFSNIARIDALDFAKVARYLELYDSRFLYQKTGFVLWALRKNLGAPEDLLLLCKKKSGGTVRYLECGPSAKKKSYVKEWNLYIPKGLEEFYES